MVIVLMITMVTMLVGLAAMLVSSTDLKITWNYQRGAQAFFAAEAGVQRSLAELREDNTWTDGFSVTQQSHGTNYEVAVTAISEQLMKITAVGRSNDSKRTIEVIVNVDSAFSHALNIGGDLTMAGKPRISSEGVRLNGNAWFDLDNGTPQLNIYAPSTSTLTYAEGSQTTPVNYVETPPMDLNAAKLPDDDWASLASHADPSYTYDDDGIVGNKDMSVTINDLDFNDVPADAEGKRTIYVDGDINLNGSIAGIGTIIATGKIMGFGGFHTSGTPTISFIARDDVLLNFDTNAQSQLNGLTYTEGNYEMHGKIKYTGVVTSFGSAIVQNPSEFTNNNDPNYWYTYSAAYSIVSDPVDIITWQELTV
ncbi:MAG: pilus assembly PilX N-terminal domain-containing protein [Deltaproteobacteria bacterium]|nr:pilus assembly PilX N-terminal domain-containing protein [Deltaproteobacteria bacterium]